MEQIPKQQKPTDATSPDVNARVAEPGPPTNDALAAFARAKRFAAAEAVMAQRIARVV